MSQLDIRRVVTGHDEQGRGIFLTDESVEPKPLAVTTAKGVQSIDFVSVWSTEAVPSADNNSTTPTVVDVDLSDAAKGHVFDDGIIFRIADLPPGSSSPMHRSLTVDYGILLEGECDLTLDGGETKRLKRGDVVIQRGTNHAWVNRSGATCRWAWILISADPIDVGGSRLPTAWGDAPEL